MRPECGRKSDTRGRDRMVFAQQGSVLPCSSECERVHARSMQLSILLVFRRCPGLLTGLGLGVCLNLDDLEMSSRLRAVAFSVMLSCSSHLAKCKCANPECLLEAMMHRILVCRLLTRTAHVVNFKFPRIARFH